MQSQLQHSILAPQNTWRLCSACTARLRAERHHSGSSSSSRGFSTCFAAAPQQPEQPGLPPLQSQTSQQGIPSDKHQDAFQDYTASIQLPNTPRPVPPRPPPALSWIPPQLWTHLQALLGFLKACWALLPEFVSPSLSQATQRLCLVLGASLVMVVLVSTIDSGWLYLYLLNTRRVAA